MILPTKKLRPENSLIYLGGQILRTLNEPKTVSGVWHEFQLARVGKAGRNDVSFDWFVLALDLLHITGSVFLVDGRLQKRS